MRSKNPFLLALLFGTLAFAPACGGDDDSSVDAAGDGDGDGDGDIDAAPVETGLGQVCDNTVMCPATGATNCVAISGTATHGWCTLDCGETQTTTPPGASGNTICADAYSRPSPAEGTPLCAIYSGTGAAMDQPPFTWSCAIGCGNLQGTELGGCPTGLTCTANICQ
jgi:hypothetical protein